ncbi:adenine phosphoribosyltransferase [soil metagenome]
MSRPGQLGERVAGLIREVPDFPAAGVLFRDITPLLADGPTFAAVVEAICARHSGGFDVVAGIEARGFLLAGAIGHSTGVGIVPIRKAGKLPWHTVRAAYTLEYGEAAVEVHADAVAPGQRVLVVDDVLATGGTLGAAVQVIDDLDAEVTGISVLLELAELGGRARLTGHDVHAVLTV